MIILKTKTLFWFFTATFLLLPFYIVRAGLGPVDFPSGFTGGNSGGGFTGGNSGGGFTGGNSGGGGGLQNPLKFNSIAEFFTAFLKILIQVGFPLVVLAVIYTGFLFVKAQGNSEELKKAKTAFFYTVVGALLILGAYAISELIQSTVNQITN